MYPLRFKSLRKLRKELIFFNMANNLSQRVCFYIDGYNFYYGLKQKDWKEFYWLDMVSFCTSLIKPIHNVISVNYFSAPPLHHASKVKRQRRFFDANDQNPLFSLFLSTHKPSNKTCKKCGDTIFDSEEKQTDVKIATEMLTNCANKICDLSVLMTGDTDLIPALKALKRIDSSHKVMIFFPPKRTTHIMKAQADGWKDLGLPFYRAKFISGLLNDEVVNGEGSTIQIPAKWKAYQGKI